ncbi:MAG: chloride channel protein [Pseudomonadales bacterium]|nr:chloride channel protein [Pseudomonadales bacterium]
MLCFRYLIDGSLNLMLAGEVENFEQLSAATRVALLIGSALLIGLALNRYRPGARRVGVVHVMERLTLHQGKLPLKNAVIQFFGGALALIAGQSGGREGPAIHLGATAASLLGQASKLPNNSLRTMVACGTAAAIASSFNTPIAGVIFALEVVMMEYAIASFIPIIVAAVTSTLITRFFFGADPAFIIDPFHLYTSFEIFYLVLGGILIGCISAAYVQLIQLFARLSLQPLWLRIALAGAITATVAIFIPEVMGVGYDTVDRIMITDRGVLFLVALLIGKTITSAAAVGLGMPVGLIGPTLFMGATVGGMLGSILINWHGIDSSIGFFVILGMCAMMGAVLQAPLAALMAVMEMTANTDFILPAMVIIVIATLVSSQVFGQRSVFITTLNTLGLQYPPSPVTLHLQRVGVTALMDTSFLPLSSTISATDVPAILNKNPNWLVIEDEDSILNAVLNPSDLDAFFKGHELAENETIRLMQIPGQRMDAVAIGSEATVMQLHDVFEKTQAEACCVTQTTNNIAIVVGVITKNHIENYRNTTS